MNITLKKTHVLSPITKTDKIGIIGGKGVMGKWLQNFLKEQNYIVKISDINTELTNSKIVEICRVIIISTPIQEAIKISKQIGKKLKHDQVLVDICSQKELILSAMLKNSSSDVLGTHPMFGPTIKSVKNQNIVVCRGRGEIGYNWIKELFSNAGAKVKTLNAVEHDKNMAVVQSLTHFIAISFAKTLKTMGIHPEDIVNVSTPIFRLNSDLIGRLFAQDHELYAILIGSNKHAAQCIKIFLESFNETKDNLISGSLKDATEYITETGAFFDDNYKKDAIDRSDKFLNAIFE